MNWESWLEPKNSLTKQYEKLFEFENVKLRFNEDLLEAVAEKAIERKSGARGLRAILEDIMLDIMYDLPSSTDIEECIIGNEVLTKKAKPIMVYGKKKKYA